jgi:hypothetical protein
MKTGNVLHAGILFTQTKSKREDKANDKREQNNTLMDTVDLSTNGLTSTPTSIASYGEALNLVNNMDFRQSMDAHKISKDAVAQVLDLI